jgi:hypothetical protein
VSILRLGPVQRRISRAFIANPGIELCTTDLVRLAFPRLSRDALRKAHWGSVRRAAAGVAVCIGQKRRSGGLIWVAKPMQNAE